MNELTVYSLDICRQLIALGYTPIKTLPNPEDNRYASWIFEATEDFRNVLSALVRERREHNGK